MGNTYFLCSCNLTVYLVFITSTSFILYTGYLFFNLCSKAFILDERSCELFLSDDDFSSFAFLLVVVGDGLVSLWLPNGPTCHCLSCVSCDAAAAPDQCHHSGGSQVGFSFSWNSLSGERR